MKAPPRVATAAGSALLLLGCSSGSPDSLSPAADAGAPPGVSGGDAAATSSGASAAGAYDAAPGALGALPCDVSLCLAGAMRRGDSWNQVFDSLCDGPEIRGVVQSCDAVTCYNTFNSFGIDVKTIYPSLFKALDKNGDGKVDSRDPACRVHLLGFSWGGVAATQLAQMLVTDANVDPSRRSVTTLVAIDPFQPGATVSVAAGVAHFYEFRHSKAPSTDCSNIAPLGPYTGLAPHCPDPGVCVDYDYSLAPTTEFQTDDGGTMKGGDVGHCDVPSVAGPAVREILRGATLTDLPPEVPISP